MIDASAALHVAMASAATPGLDGYELLAPPLFLSEWTSALAAAAYRHEIDEPRTLAAFDRLGALGISIVDGEIEDVRRALVLARSLGWAKSYDAEYVVLAQQRSCPLLTIDARLRRGAGHLVEMLDPLSLA